jgi:carboxypeptidase PM20D1
MKKPLLYFGSVLLVFFLFLIGNTLLFKSKQHTTYEAKPAPALTSSAISNFQQAIRFKTISHYDTLLNDTSAFKGFHRFLKNAYPVVHTELRREVINNYSLLYTWPGTDTTLKPILLMAHMDVVPVEDATTALWEVNAFDGIIKDGYVWGRGTVDDKINLISIMQATEELLSKGFKPKRTIYYAFGHDEEITGPRGAKKIAELLMQRNVKADLILDEGGIITSDKIPNMATPVALLGTSEKGYLTLTMKVEKSGGHSSMPEAETAVDILTNAIAKIRSNPLPARITPSQKDFIQYIGPQLPFIPKLAFANEWLFEKLIINQYSKSASGNALMRTTAVPTIIQAGVKDNVVPTVATATINLRLLPGDSSSWVVNQLSEIINDERVTIEVLHSQEASVSTSVKSFGYKTIEKVTNLTFDSTVTTPFLLIGGTDSRHFTKISDNIIRFSPVVDPIGFHGVNERVSLESYRLSIWFYQQLLTEMVY